MDYSSNGFPKFKTQRSDRETPEIAIASASDLHQLLTSQQSSAPGLKTTVQRFTKFLSAVTSSVNEEDRDRRLTILKAYSEEQLPVSREATAFPDLVSTWSFAVETNNEQLLSTIPSTLAQYLSIVSCHLQFRDIGLALCKSLLMKEQLQLFARGLTATKTKEHLISPCLQLLTEIVSFDGGEVASLVYSKRETTFRRLEVFLDQRALPTIKSGDMLSTSTLRSISQRYVLANLRFQSSSAIGDIIAQGKILGTYLKNLKDDQAGIVYDVLVSLEKDIIREHSLSKGIKSRLFGKSNLSSLATLYAFPEPTLKAVSTKSIREQVDLVLRLVCTQQDSGILLAQNGWYPPGTNPDKTLSVTTDPKLIDLDTTLSFNHSSKDKFPTKNVVLSLFIQALRPEIDSLQASLLLDIFRAAPELVADYFSRKNNFIAEPKDTPAWLGQSAFLFSTMQLPVPRYCGWKDGYAVLPPPSSTVIESILPRPLDRSNITRSLNMNHEIITLFAVRAVTVAFQKLEKVLGAYQAAEPNKRSWREASSDLLIHFSQRCPLAKDILSTLQRTPKSDEKLHGATVELIFRYYQALPHLILSEKFDVSLALADVIKRLGTNTEDSSLESSRLCELENLLKIAQVTSDAKWWQKPDSLSYSPFTSMLKHVVEVRPSVPAILSIKRLLRRIAVEHGVLLDNLFSFDALVTSLTQCNNWTPSPKMISFFDNCVSRIARQPVQYVDFAAGNNGGDTAVSLLAFCIAEQWPFVTELQDPDDQENIAEWIARFLALLIHAGEDRGLIQKLHSQISDAANDAAVHERLNSTQQTRLTEADAPKTAGGSDKMANESNLLPRDKSPRMSNVLETTFEPLTRRTEVVRGFERTSQNDLEALVANGRLSSLCRSLSSSVEETRRQGFVTLQQITKQIMLSSYTGTGPLVVLMGEVGETASSFGLLSPLPSVFTEFAAEAVGTLDQPSHFMYGKINNFLQKRPSWDVPKFFAYWVEKILLREPEDHNGHSQETAWLLSLLVRGLQAVTDMEVYRRSNVFERVFALYHSPLCSGQHRRQVLELVYRSISLGGGMTLITRMGVESWFAIEQAYDKELQVIGELENQLHGHVDSAAVEHWKIPAEAAIDAH